MSKEVLVSTDPNTIQHFLTRSVENVYPNAQALEAAFVSGKRLTIYTGIDPTGPTLHLGHVIWLKKHAELQKMGHKIILLIGDFTGLIGDPTDKLATRKQLTREEVLANCKQYQAQASRFISFDGPNPAELKFNSEWLSKMTFEDVINLAAHFTVQQMLERDMFEQRIEDKKPIHVHEFLYPLMQGYDSVAMDVDMEIGGNDQTFNMLAGRTLMKEIKSKEKFVLTTKLLVDPTGKKMGKTEGNMITLADSPEDMYGKVMSWTDGMIWPGFELVTDVPMEDIQQMKQAVEKGENPMIYKRRLAEEVVRALASDEAARQSARHFTTVHQRGEKPEDVKEFSVEAHGVRRGAAGESKLVDVLVASGLTSSKTEARRQIEQGGVKVDDVVVTDVEMLVRAEMVIQKGKRHFVKLV